MNAESKTPSSELRHTEAGLPATVGRGDRGFPVGLGLALAVHVALVIGFGTAAAPQRTIGTPDGSRDAISVELIGPSELDGATAAPPSEAVAPTPPTPAMAPPVAPPQVAALPEPARPAVPPLAAPPPPSLKPSLQPEPETQKAEPLPEVAEPATAQPQATTPDPAAEAQKPPPPGRAEKSVPSKSREAAKRPELIDRESIEELTRLEPQPTAKPKTKTAAAAPSQQAKPSEAKPKPKSLSELDLSLPAGPAMLSPGGGVAGVSRPPGITRSGENDDFARGVIRALRKTMPESRVFTGRVTIRITLDTTGNLAEVKLVASSGDNSFDQAVMFAAKQSSFPIPPARSIPVDRIFLITYIYTISR